MSKEDDEAIARGDYTEEEIYGVGGKANQTKPPVQVIVTGISHGQIPFEKIAPLLEVLKEYMSDIVIHHVRYDAKPNLPSAQAIEEGKLKQAAQRLKRVAKIPTPEERRAEFQTRLKAMDQRLIRPQDEIPNLAGFSEEHRAEAAREATEMGRGVRMEIHSSHTEFYATTTVPVGQMDVWFPPTYKGQLVYDMTLIDPRQPFMPRTWRSDEFQNTMDLYVSEHADEYAEILARRHEAGWS